MPTSSAATRVTRAEPRAGRYHAGWRIALLFVGVLVPLWGFVELAEEVHELEGFVFDDPLLLRAHALAGPGLDRFFIVVSSLGYRGVIVIDVLLTLVLLACRRWRAAAYCAIAFTGSALLNLGSKRFFHRQRPSLWESVAPESSFSFPSGHAMGAMTLALAVVLLAWPTRWRRPVLWLALAFVLLVGASRVYLGVHYPSDVLGGWAAAAAWTIGVFLLMRPHPAFGPRRR